MGLGLAVKYQREELLHLLRQLTARLGRSPRAEDINREPNFPSAPVFQRHFGGLATARLEAGLPKPQRMHRWTTDAIDGALQRAAKELGRAPTERDLSRVVYLPSPATVREVAGSLRERLARLGIDRGKKWHPNDDISDEELIVHLKQVARRLGKSPSMKAYRKAGGKFSDKLYIQRFGSWNAALSRAGLALHRQEVPSREVLCKKLVTLQARLGRPPCIRDLQMYSDMPPATAYRKRFKNWREVLILAGIGTEHMPMQLESINDETLLEALRELARRLGRSPDSKLALYLKGFPSPKVFADRFGSWNNALREAGLSVNRRNYRAKDGCRCDSKQERLIDDFFKEQGIEHELHPLYPRHPELNPRMDHIADWCLKDGTLVEYFGVVGKPWYEKKIRLKLKLAQATGVQLISIYPKDLQFHHGLLEIFGQDRFKGVIRD